MFLVDLNEAAAAETARIIEGEGGTCGMYRCDMLAAAAVQDMVQVCVDRFKRIDILVNNVGGSEPGDAVSMPEAVWDRQIDFNLKTAFLGCKYVIPVMQAQGDGRDRQHRLESPGCATSRAGASIVAYSASKAGVIQFSRIDGRPLSPSGIRCNTVVPGLMHTPLVEHRLARQSRRQRCRGADRQAQCAAAARPHGHRVGRGSRRAVPRIGRSGLHHRRRDRRGRRPDARMMP